jgi:hypothetical protein
MVDDWPLLAKKANSNLDLAEAIATGHQSGDLGFAMFHAQQAVELSVKACIFKYSLHKYIIKKELRRELFTWEDPNEQVSLTLLPYLRKSVGLTWISPNASVVIKSDLINVRENGKYANLIPRRRTRTIDVTFDGKVIHELYFELDNGRRRVFAEDLTFRSHDPLIKLLDEAHQFTKSRTDDTTLIDDDFTNQAQRFLKALADMVALMKKMEKDEELLIAVWQKSLGIDSDNSELKSFMRQLKTIDESGIVNDLGKKCTDFIRSAVLALFKKIKSARRSLAIRYKVLPEVKNILNEYSLPPSLVDAFLATDTALYDAEISKFVKEIGGIRILNIIFRPNGILESLSKMDKDFKTMEFRNASNRITEFAKRYSWLSHVAAISSVLLLMYPHVNVGRYPRRIGSTDSDSIYLKQLPHVKTRVEDCRKACEDLQNLLGYHFVSEDIRAKK